MRSLALYSLVLVIPVAAAAARRAPTFVDELAAAFEDPALDRATLSARVVGVESGEVVWEVSPDSLVVPASTTKIVTAMALLDSGVDLGRSFETPLLGAGPVEGGVLRGDLVVVGVGDPSLGPDALTSWLAGLKERGITRIEGDVLADARLFGAPPLGLGWMWDDATVYFSPPVTALTWERNVGTIGLAPGAAVGDPVVVRQNPCIPLDVVATTAAAPAEGEEAPGVHLERLPGNGSTWVRGGIAIGAPPEDVRLTLPDPPTCVALTLRDALIAQGIAVTGVAGRLDSPTGIAPAPPADAEVLAVHRSAPLRDLVGIMLVESDNLFAESFARSLDPAPVGRTYEGARPAYEALMAAAGVPEDAWRLSDGSGLSRYDLLAADTIVALLRYGWTRPWRDELLELMPSSGEGTLRSRLVGGPAEQRGHAKTGSMTGVFNIVGYVHPEQGEVLAFALLSNGVVAPGSTARGAQDAVLQLLAARPVQAPSGGCLGRPD